MVGFAAEYYTQIFFIAASFRMSTGRVAVVVHEILTVTAL